MMSRTAIHPFKILAALGAAFLVWGLVLAYASSPAWAADITVTTADDELNSDGDCSLREAITAANTDAASDGCDAGSGEDTINLPSGTYPLSSQLPNITSIVTVDGGSPNPTIDGGNAVRPFFVASGAKLSLNELTLTKGNTASDDGGAIRNQGTLVVSNSTLSGNTSSFDGGAIFNQGTLTVSNSTFSDNSAVGGVSEGGAINNTSSGTLTVSNSTFSDNSAINGGAIFNRGTLTVSNSTFSGNSTSGDGGGIWNHSAITLTVTNSTFSDNSANAGGGIFNDSGAVTLKNTIVANSPSGGNCAASAGQTITDGGYNLSSDASCITAATSLSGDPMLGDLADNGGPTETIALQEGSPAIDKGNSFGTTTDQRGEDRPSDFLSITNADGGDGSDIGAYEEQAPPALSIDDLSVTEGDSGTTPNATFTVSLSEASAQAVTVDFATADGTATAGADYQTTTGTLTFPPGTTSRTVSVPIIDDVVDEEGETFFVNLSNPTNATISDARGEGTITDDDPPPNTAPTAEGDSFSTNEDTPLRVEEPGLLANDTDPDSGDTLEAVVESDPSHGTLTLNANGSFTYTPNANFSGSDSFTYKANDGTADSNEATVSISVRAANDTPSVRVAQGGSCGSASDMRGTINLALTDPDDSPESLTLTATSSNRSVLPNSNISFGGGTDASRTMTVSSLTGSGTSNVTIRVSDGDLNGTVLVRVISGSASNNTLSGSTNSEMIFARKGSDTLSAQGANDLMCAGNGNDRLTGGLGADHFGGGTGTDTATDFNASQGDTKAGIP